VKIQGDPYCEFCRRAFHDTGEYRRHPDGGLVCRARGRCFGRNLTPEARLFHKPSWLGRLRTEILPALEAASVSHLDRKAVETLLRVSQTEANRILKRAGAAALSGRLLVPRPTFLAWLQALAESPETERSERRVERVAETLAAALVDQKHRQRPNLVPEERTVELVSTRFRKLPPDVQLTPGRLTIVFSGTQDFLAKFGAMVYALQNDYEEIAAFLQQSSAGTKPV
jgi:hypothetical protein